MVRHLVFDLGNVLLAWDPLTVTLPPALAGQWDEVSQRAAREALFWPRLASPRRRHPLRGNARSAVQRRRTSLPQALFVALVEAMPASLVPITPMLTFLARVAAHTPCHLLSNIAHDTWRAVCQRHAFHHCFQSMTLTLRRWRE